MFKAIVLSAFVLMVAGAVGLIRPVVALTPVTIYDAFPAGAPGNVSSIGFEATSTSEFGDHIQVAGSQRALSSATVLMSSWGCESGAWFSNDCSTTPGATFGHSLTLTLYSVVDVLGTPTAGTVLASKTQTFPIPFRPSADVVNCTGGRWYSALEGRCFYGLATPVTFTFAGEALPNEVIWGISYNTTHHGYTPIGDAAPCYTEAGGCGYDSLNVGAQSFTPIVGTDVAEEAAFVNYSSGGAYSDGGAGGVGTFRYDGGPSWWTGYRPLIRITATDLLVGPPDSKDQCKNNGWKLFNNPAFKNQGDCIQYVNTGK